MIVGYERPITSGTLRPSREACESCHYPVGRAPRQHRGEGQLRHRRGEQRVAHQARAAHRHGRHPPRLHPRHPLAHPERGALCVARPAAARDPLGGGDQARRQQGGLHRRRNQAQRRSRSRPCRRGRWPATTATTRWATPSPTRPRWWTRPSAPARSTARCPTPRRVPWPCWTSCQITGDDQGREAMVDKLLADATAKAATAAEFKPAEQKFNTEMRGILMAASFHEKDFSWKSFPNHTGHADTAGCFRCHDGKHFNDKGEAIRLQCTLCHACPRWRAKTARARWLRCCPKRPARSSPTATSGRTSCTPTPTTWHPSAKSATARRSSAASRVATSAPTRPATAANGPA
jgi:hypothetical protein